MQVGTDWKQWSLNILEVGRESITGIQVAGLLSINIRWRILFTYTYIYIYIYVHPSGAIVSYPLFGKSYKNALGLDWTSCKHNRNSWWCVLLLKIPCCSRGKRNRNSHSIAPWSAPAQTELHRNISFAPAETWKHMICLLFWHFGAKTCQDRALLGIESRCDLSSRLLMYVPPGSPSDLSLRLFGGALNTELGDTQVERTPATKWTRNSWRVAALFHPFRVTGEPFTLIETES